MTSRIALTGPESTGKSFLAEALAKHYDAGWVPEYSREYLRNLGRAYQPGDLEAIARGQRDAELLLLPGQGRLLFCDTEPLVTRIWSYHAFGACPEWIESELTDNPHDHYLLCDIDLPWEPDPLREHPDLREYLFGLYFGELSRRRLSFSIVSGIGKERLRNAIMAVDRWLSQRPH